MGWFGADAQAGQPEAVAPTGYDAGAAGVYAGAYDSQSVFENTYSDPKAEKLGEDLLRWSMCSLTVNLAIAICFAVAWIPGVDWFSISYFNGNPAQGQNVGIVGGCLIWTTVDPLGWNGAPFTFTDIEEADIMCNGPLITSENCQGLMNKLNCHNLYSILFTLGLICLLPGIVWSSWLIHQLRFGTLERVQDQAMIGYWGCITSSTKWWADPCTFIYLQTIIFVPMVLFGIPAWPIAMSFTMRFWIAFGGLWFGGAQTIFGVQGELAMTEGYDLMCCGTVLLIVALACGVKLRDTYRELVYCGGIDTSEDATQFGNVVMENILGRARSFTKVLNYIPTITFGGGADTTTSSSSSSGELRDRSPSTVAAIRDRSASTAPPRDRSQSSAPPPGNREYSKSSLDQMIPSEAEMMGGQGGFDPGAMSHGFGKGGGAQQQQQQQMVQYQHQEEPMDDFGASNPFGEGVGKGL